MDVQKFRQQIYDSARPLLQGRTVSDLVIGLSLLEVELDGKYYAVSYVLRDGLAGGCSVFSYATKAVGMSAEEAGAWFVNGKDDVQRAIGGAVLNAASRLLGLVDTGSRERPFDVDISPSDTVGMVGNIRPVAMQLKKLGCRMIIFDRGKCSRGNAAEDIYPMEQQAELLPECDIVFLSGTTAVNGTAPALLDMCSSARDIVMLGSSTPMIPGGYAGTGVSVLAGSWWPQEARDEVFTLISRAAGIQTLKQYMIKKNVRIK